MHYRNGVKGKGKKSRRLEGRRGLKKKGSKEERGVKVEEKREGDGSGWGEKEGSRLVEEGRKMDVREK